MKYKEIFGRAWDYARTYRALWLLGAVLALTTVNGLFFVYDWDRDPGWHGFKIVDGRLYVPDGDLIIDFRDPGWPTVEIEGWNSDEVQDLLTWQWWREELSDDVLAVVIASLVVVAGATLLGIIGRYIAEAGLIRVVARTEESGERIGMRKGLRMGFSRSAWRLFGIDVVFFLLKVLVYLGLLAGALSPLLLWQTRSNAAGAAGTAVAVMLVFLWLVVVMAIGALLSMLIQVIRRACAVDGVGVVASIRRGSRTVRSHAKEVAVMWLAWLGVRLAWTLASIPVLILISPLLLPLVLVGAIAGGLPAIAVAGALSPVLGGPFHWIVGAIVGGPIFLLVLMAPMLFLGGLVEVFKSSMWTLSYRSLRSMESAQPAHAQPAEMSGLEPAAAT